MISQESKPDALASRVGQAIRDYWHSPKGRLRRQIERVLSSYERIPANERQREKMVTLSDGTQVQYGTAVDYVVINMLRIAGRGFDLSAYKPRVAALRSY